jgi:glycosyltransferase involved in cell wall biosynthesis
MTLISETCATRPTWRIAYVTETYPPEVNGVSMTVARVVEGLRTRGHRVQLVRLRQHHGDIPLHADGSGEVLMPGWPIPRYPGLKMGLPQVSALVRLWRADRPDLVHIATEGPLGWSALRAARRLGLPVSSDFRTNFHAYASHYGLSVLKRPVLAYLRWFHQRTACTMVPTESLRRELESHGFGHLSVVARGVDSQRFHPDKRSAELRRQWGVDPDAMVVLCVGRLAAEKNLDAVVSAYRAMHRVNPKVTLVMVGDGPARASLQAACPQALLVGSKTADELAVHYASADAFVFASLTETFGNVTPEAMASALPVLAFDYAAAAQLIRSGENGLLAPCGDARAFDELAAQLAADPARAAAMGQAARRTAEQLDWAGVLDKIEALFASVLRGGHGAPAAANASGSVASSIAKA